MTNPHEPTAEQQRVLDRIAQQRERLRARHAARAQSLALVKESGRAVNPEDPLALRLATFAREHPMALAVVAGAAVVAGPRRLVRWAGVLMPLLMRIKR
ncbi:MAG: hypothetical protein QM569_14040 [Acidovorax sp.]|uniref:hypothetical protein n=1 Tax=Acidovorax sp. TaxID=1872122 RepID=UPI0039E530DB